MVNLSTMNYFEAIPYEVQVKIFDYLTLKELVGKLARSSKRVADIVQNSISVVNGPHNSLNIILTGHSSAGSTTLYSRLQEEISINSVVRNLAESKEITSTSIVDDHRSQICAIKLENIRANLWHGSAKDNRVKRMYPHIGVAQCIIYVVSCSEIATRIDGLRNDMICYHALSSEVQWIFVINKMDQVQYNEQEYNKCVDSINKIAVKVIGEQRMNNLHFIPMTANDMQTRVTGDDNTCMTWCNKKSINLWHVLNQVANESCSSPLKLFRKFKASVIRTYGWGVKNVDRKDGIAIVYIIEGCVSVGDTIQILPEPLSSYPEMRYHFDEEARFAPTVVTGIQSFGTNKNIALPNSYVSLAIKKIESVRFSYSSSGSELYFPIPKISMIQYPIVTPTNKPNFLNQILWFKRPDYEAVIVHVGNQNGRYKWNGLIHEDFDAAIHGIGIRGSIKLTKIKAIYDKNGNPLDLEEVKKERKVLALKKGEKAEVTLHAKIRLNLTIRDSPPSLNDVNGRFVIQTQNNHIVAAGSIVSMTKFFFSE